MTLDEAYEIWKSKYVPSRCGSNCVHGLIEGGPGFCGFVGCSLYNHSDVIYGVKYCPKDCIDFELKESILYKSSFWKLLHNTTFRESMIINFGIDPDDIVELQEEAKKAKDREKVDELKNQLMTDHLNKVFSCSD